MRLILPLIDRKIEAINQLTKLHDIYNKLDTFYKILLHEYIIKNKRDTEVASILNISIRTFYRKLSTLEKRINLLESLQTSH